MEGARTVYLSGPESIEIPPEFRLRPIEVIILPIDRPADSSGWPDDFVKHVFGSWEGGILVREPQPDFDPREDMG